jgi:SOS-response transcriptional repressor LexA
MKSLTPRQLECLDFIRTFKEQNRLMPSLSEIVDGINCSSSSHASYLLRQIEKCGKIRVFPRTPRGIELVEPEEMKAVLLNKEIFGLVRAYAASQRIAVDTAACELLRGALGAA